MEETPRDISNPEAVLKHIETIHPPEYVQALKDFLAKKITYEQMQKICHPPTQTGANSSCCEGAQ